MIAFLDELIEQFPEEAPFVIARIFIKDRIPAETVMTNFIREVMPYKQYIIRRDDTFFLNHDLPGVTQHDQGATLSHLRTIWRSSRLDTEDKEIIWQWISLFIKLAEKYQIILRSST